MASDQQAYFDQGQPGQPFQAGSPLVRSSSGKLKQAYGKLMSRYPGQSQWIQDAFFDHLCALDFV